jgi:hypothetical protein
LQLSSLTNNTLLRSNSVNTIVSTDIIDEGLGEIDFSANDLITTGTLFAGADTDVTHELGRWKMGYDGLNADLATISHYDTMSWDTWALAQDASAKTYLSGSSLSFRLSSGTVYAGLYNSGGIDPRFYIMGAALTLGGTAGSERVFLRQDGTNPTLLTMSTPYSNLGFVIEGDITAVDGTYSGTITDGTLSTTAGVVTGIASLNGGGTINLEDNLDGTGFTITGGTITDGTASMSAGSLTGVDDITMTGDLLIDSDTGQLKLGADQDLLVYHDGTDGYITNGTGVLKIPTGDLRFSDDGASDFSIGLLATAGNNPYFRLGGYLTSASDERWVSQQVSDVNDTYNIYRESPFIKGLEANMPILISTTTGYILDGTSIDSKNQSAQNTIVIENYTASVNGGAGVIGHFARGIIASPVIVNPGDRLYFNLGGGYNGASMINSCGFEARITADGTSSLTSQPTEFRFLTTPDGSVSREEVLKIRSDYLWTKTPIYLTQKDGNEYIDSLADGYTDVGATTAIRAHADIYPGTDDTYYLGKNDDDTPFAWKGVILKDTSNNKYYRIEVINGVITATDLTD